MVLSNSIWIGFDPREVDGFAVARKSIKAYITAPLPVYGIVLNDLKEQGLFYRNQFVKDGVLWDEISDAPCATEFSISRFLIKELAGRNAGWALFMDSDMMLRGNLARVFEGLDPSKAVYCVKHDYNPTDTTKMDGQVQTQYNMKNWSSFFLINCQHPANKNLTVELVNTVPGRDLHQFCWLDGDMSLIGELGEEWNWLVGHSTHPDPINVHFTTGIPSMVGYEDVPYADRWRRHLYEWARR